MADTYPLQPKSIITKGYANIVDFDFSLFLVFT
jgi:hypothetical protein